MVSRISKLNRAFLLRILGLVAAMGGIIAAPARPNNRAAAREVHEALQTIVTDAGRQFDFKVVDALPRWVSSVSKCLAKVGSVTVADLCDGRPEEIEAAEEAALA